AGGIEQFLGLVAAHPALQQLQVCRIGAYVRERHLVRAPRALDLVAFDFLRACPALRRTQYDHGPARAFGLAAFAGVLLYAADLGNYRIEGCRHLLVHLRGLRAVDEVRLVAVSDEQRLELLVADARRYGRVGDLVAVETQDRQHGAIVHGIEKLVRMP